jgi:hypothetical protein
VYFGCMRTCNIFSVGEMLGPQIILFFSLPYSKFPPKSMPMNYPTLHYYLFFHDYFSSYMICISKDIQGKIVHSSIFSFFLMQISLKIHYVNKSLQNHRFCRNFYVATNLQVK